ncbi:MAG: hypothetical protein RSB55_00940 [Oscillospiraceae bacterium]
MNKTVRRLAATLLCAVMAFSLSACTSAGVSGFDATTYLKGTLDQNYLGRYDEVFLALTDTTEPEGRRSYEENVNREFEKRFCVYFQINPAVITPETKEGLKNLLRDAYAQAKYEVSAAQALSEDEYAVKVTFHPVALFSEFASDELEGLLADFEQAYSSTTEEALAAMTPKEHKAFEKLYEEDWANSILAALEPHLGDVGYEDPVTKLIRVYPDEKEKQYTISDEDFVMMDDLILAY